MDYRRYGDTWLVRLDRGEEICEALQALAVKEGIALAEVSGLGAVDQLTTAIFDSAKREFLTNAFEGAFEITSLTGTVTTLEGQPHLHLHISAGDLQGRVVGGHLKRAVISVTAEILVRALPGRSERRYDPEIGIYVLGFQD